MNSIGVASALNLDTSSILFTSKSNADKAQTFRRTGSGSYVDAWKLTLQDGEGFSVNRIKGESGSVSPGAYCLKVFEESVSGTENVES